MITVEIEAEVEGERKGNSELRKNMGPMMTYSLLRGFLKWV